MTGELGYSLPPAIRRIATNFRLAGWMGLWIQAVIGVIATLMFTIFLMGGGASAAKAGASLFLTPSLCLIFVKVFWCFRYVRFGRRLRTSNPDLRPKPKDAVRIVSIGLMISLVGTALAIMGAESIVAPLFFKGLDQGLVGIAANVPIANFITAGDILSVFAAINTTFTHFVGLCVSLWLQFMVNRQ